MNRLFRRERFRNFEPYSLSISKIESDDDDAEVFVLTLFFVTFIVPMESRIVPVLDELKEPDNRLFRV